MRGSENSLKPNFLERSFPDGGYITSRQTFVEGEMKVAIFGAAGDTGRILSARRSKVATR